MSNSFEFNQINPYNNEFIRSYIKIDDKELNGKLILAKNEFKKWKVTAIIERVKMLKVLSSNLQKGMEDFSSDMSMEMGKPIRAARAEVRKCIWLCDYYAKNASSFLKFDEVETDAKSSKVYYDPLGVILGIMPWNYPFWQVFRFAIPSIIAGNTVLLKHAPNSLRSAENIEMLFKKSGFPEGVFQSLVIDHDQAATVIKNDIVKAVSLTGSEKAGSVVGSIAGSQIKKMVMELGGSNAFVVLEDANIERAVKVAVNARFQNTGQSCIAAKRFIIHTSVYNDFIDQFETKMKSLKMGDPLDETTDIGPLARPDLADKLDDQIKRALDDGALKRMGGRRTDNFIEPTILENVLPGNTAFKEELFGPVASFCSFDTLNEAFDLVNATQYGLGVTFFTSNPEKVLSKRVQIDDGAVFINELVKSDPRLPFGGTKKSGYGRELAREGMLEFVNKKVVYISGDQ